MRTLVSRGPWRSRRGPGPGTHRCRRGRPRRQTRCRSPAPPPATERVPQTRIFAGRHPAPQPLASLRTARRVAWRVEPPRTARRERAARRQTGDRSAPLFSRAAAIFWWRCDLRGAEPADTHLLGNVLLIQRMRPELMRQELEHIEPRLVPSPHSLTRVTPGPARHDRTRHSARLARRHAYGEHSDTILDLITYPHSTRDEHRPPPSNAGLLLVGGVASRTTQSAEVGTPH